MFACIDLPPKTSISTNLKWTENISFRAVFDSQRVALDATHPESVNTQCQNTRRSIANLLITNFHRTTDIIKKLKIVLSFPFISI